MNTIQKALTSRTVWAIVGMFFFSGLAGISGMLPPAWLPFINGLLGVLAIYYKLNPSQTYGK